MEPQLEDFELRKEVSCRVVLMTSHCLIARIPTGAVVEIKEGEIGVTSFSTVEPCTTHQEVGAPCAPKINPGPTVPTTETGIKKKVNVSKLGANSNQVQHVPDCAILLSEVLVVM